MGGGNQQAVAAITPSTIVFLDITSSHFNKKTKGYRYPAAEGASMFNYEIAGSVKEK